MNVLIPLRDGQGNPYNNIKVIEEFFSQSDEPTSGRWQAKSFEFNITHAIGTWANYDFSFPFPISIFSTEWINQSLFNGDFVQVLMAPDTVTGVITSDVAINDTLIDVSQTVVDNARVGYKLNLDDGTNVDTLGRVLSIDKDNLKITMETPAVNAFVVSSPTYVKQTIEMIPSIYLMSSGRVELAKDAVGGSYIPKNTTIRLRYQNNEGTIIGKVFSFIIEYKY